MDSCDKSEEVTPVCRHNVACQTEQTRCKDVVQSEERCNGSRSSSEEEYESDALVSNPKRKYVTRYRRSPCLCLKRCFRNILDNPSLFARLTVEIVVCTVIVVYLLDSFMESHYGLGVVSIFEYAITYVQRP
jgi:hypothetical protein